ncbi:MAG TPA: tRNA pseudouridine(55) synthase TruB, partial [Campylobacteraceae bacterium]|nr:tRNA pseudouridine(55) synthase TruB [Campylobacteraceae bacterium]
MAASDRLFVAYKPAGIGSNRFLSQIKRRYGIKKAGFSGTLDPFAQGVLIIAFGKYTKLFRFLKKAPKTYRATLWLGAGSP